MNRIQFALFPSILLGILALLLFASLASTSEDVQAAVSFTETPAIAATTPNSNPPHAAAPTTPAKAVKDCTLPTRYPASIRQWCSLIEKYARPAGLEPELIAAVMLQESGGNPKVISASGAVGLMQVMPRDGPAASWQCPSGPCFASRPTTSQLMDPDFNVSYGVRMLAGLVQKTGSLRDALRAYGPIDVGYSYADKVLRIHENYQ